LKKVKFADDNFTVCWNSDKNELIKDLEKELETLTKWLSDSGLKVNENKTELVLFYRKDCRRVTLRINNTRIWSLDYMNVLGVVFDSKLGWAQHIATAVTKANKAINAIRLIRRYFSNKELLGLLTSNYILYCTTTLRYGTCQFLNLNKNSYYCQHLP
jgi:hypothetical protein